MSKELGNLQLLYLDLNDMICGVVRFDSQKKQLYWEWKKGRGSEKRVSLSVTAAEQVIRDQETWQLLWPPIWSLRL